MNEKIERLHQLLMKYPEPWLIEKEPHPYNDGTKEFTHVRYRHKLDNEEFTVSIGEHVTLDLAELLILLREVACTLPAEVERLQSWVDDLQSNMYVNCVYCGFRYGPSSTTPVTMADALKAHVALCTEHPMSALLASLKEFQQVIIFDEEGDQTAAEFSAMCTRADEAVAKVQP